MTARPASIPAALRNIVSECLAKGYAVEIRPDGTFRAEPAPPQAEAKNSAAFDLVNFKR